jgi:hypothetical protein
MIHAHHDLDILLCESIEISVNLMIDHSVAQQVSWIELVKVEINMKK